MTSPYTLKTSTSISSHTFASTVLRTSMFGILFLMVVSLPSVEMQAVCHEGFHLEVDGDGCRPCEFGKFQPEKFSKVLSCHPWSAKGTHEVVVKNGTDRSDVEYGCEAGYEKRLAPGSLTLMECQPVDNSTSAAPAVLQSSTQAPVVVMSVRPVTTVPPDDESDSTLIVVGGIIAIIVLVIVLVIVIMRCCKKKSKSADIETGITPESNHKENYPLIEEEPVKPISLRSNISREFCKYLAVKLGHEYLPRFLVVLRDPATNMDAATEFETVQSDLTVRGEKNILLKSGEEVLWNWAERNPDADHRKLLTDALNFIDQMPILEQVESQLEMHLLNEGSQNQLVNHAQSQSESFCILYRLFQFLIRELNDDILDHLIRQLPSSASYDPVKVLRDARRKSNRNEAEEVYFESLRKWREVNKSIYLREAFENSLQELDQNELLQNGTYNELMDELCPSVDSVVENNNDELSPLLPATVNPTAPEAEDERDGSNRQIPVEEEIVVHSQVNLNQAPPMNTASPLGETDVKTSSGPKPATKEPLFDIDPNIPAVEMFNSLARESKRKKKQALDESFELLHGTGHSPSVLSDNSQEDLSLNCNIPENGNIEVNNSDTEVNNVNSHNEVNNVNSDNEVNNANSDNEVNNANSDNEVNNDNSDNEMTNANSDNIVNNVNSDNEVNNVNNDNEVNNANSDNEVNNANGDNEENNANSDNEVNNANSDNEVNNANGDNEENNANSDNEENNANSDNEVSNANSNSGYVEHPAIDVSTAQDEESRKEVSFDEDNGGHGNAEQNKNECSDS